MLTLQKKLMAVYNFIGEELYLAPLDLTVKDEAFSSTLLLSLLNCVLNTNALLVGEYGTGKTTVAELVGCIVTGMPLSAVVHGEVRASPETTEASVIARLDLGELNRGIEKPVWALFAKSPVHIVDEISRLPEIRQALLLEGIRKGQWLYLGQLLETGKSALFATANWEELGGSFDITPALRDRFSVCIESLYAGARTTARIAEMNTDEKVHDLDLNWNCTEAVQLLNAEYNADAMSAFREEFKGHVSQRGVPTLLEAEVHKTQAAIEGMEFSDESQLFFEFIVSSLNFCMLRGMKRSARFGEGQTSPDCPHDCRFHNTACSRILNGGSRRKEADIRRFAKALAWLMGDHQVEVAHLVAVAPFALWHRSTFSSSFLAGMKAQQRTMPLHLEAAHRYLAELQSEFRARKEMFAEAIRFLDEQSDETPRGAVLIRKKSYTDVDLPHPFLADCARHSRGG